MTGTEAPLSQSFVELGPVALFWRQILSFFGQKISDFWGVFLMVKIQLISLILWESFANFPISRN
jgi:hypothetical protein